MKIIVDNLQEEMAKAAVMGGMTIKDYLLKKVGMPIGTYYAILSRGKITGPQAKKLWKHVNISRVLGLHREDDKKLQKTCN